MYQGAGVVSNSVEPNCSPPCLFPSTQVPHMNSNHVDNFRDSQHVTTCSRSEPCYGLRQPLLARPSPIMRGTTVSSLPEEHNKIRSDLQGLVLTLGGPASGNHA